MSYIHEHWRSVVSVVLLVSIYVLTFKPAWRALSSLVAESATRKHKLTSARFWGDFVKYRLIISAPYLAPLLVYHRMSTTWSRVLLGWLALGVFLTLLRFVGTRRTISFLWWLYGYVYDGLLRFYPYRNLMTKVVDRLDPTVGMRVLELGCGTGNVIVEIRRRWNPIAGDEIVGVDSSASMLRQARRKLKGAPGVELVQQDIIEYVRQQPTGSFDRILLVNVLYATHDREVLWRECRRLLRPKGFIVATTSDKGGVKPIIQEHLRHARKRELVSLRLVAVFVINYFIDAFAKSGTFEFPERAVLLDEVGCAGGRTWSVERVYGGPEEGVNLLFEVA